MPPPSPPRVPLALPVPLPLAVPLALALALATAPTAARSADVPPGTEVLRVDRVPGKFGAVRFTHGAHNTRYRHVDGAPIRCRDCHHTLAGDAPASPEERERMRCSGCHVTLEETPRTVGGKEAPPLAALKPDGAVDHRSILFHRYCWACHRKLQKDGQQYARCKLCHERGVSADTIHGRYDAAPQPGAGLSWIRCAAGQRWTGKGCEGEARSLARADLDEACAEGYRLPSRAELLALLSGCPPGGRDERRSARCGCAGSAACSALFGPDEGAYWAAEGEGARGWMVRLSDGTSALAAPPATARVRCVRSDGDDAAPPGPGSRP